MQEPDGVIEIYIYIYICRPVVAPYLYLMQTTLCVLNL
jgi:hypothetical protein